MIHVSLHIIDYAACTSSGDTSSFTKSIGCDHKVVFLTGVQFRDYSLVIDTKKSGLLFIYNIYNMLSQIGDVAVLDISATTVDKDEANVQNIPSAESKGLPILKLYFHQ